VTFELSDIYLIIQMSIIRYIECC